MDAVRWAARLPGTRQCRLVLQSDSTAAVGALRKGRSSRRLLLHCRRLAAIKLAERIALEGRWIPTTRNFADGPSHGRGPAPCGNDLDGIYEGLELSRRDRRALGRFFAELQRRKVVHDFEAALLTGDLTGPLTPFVFRGLI